MQTGWPHVSRERQEGWQQEVWMLLHCPLENWVGRELKNLHDLAYGLAFFLVFICKPE